MDFLGQISTLSVYHPCLKKRGGGIESNLFGYSFDVDAKLSNYSRAHQQTGYRVSIKRFISVW